MRAPCFLLVALPLVADVAGVPVSWKTQNAKVYPDRAWLTRSAKVKFDTPGSQRFLLRGLPADLDLDGVRVRTEGLNGIKIGSVAVFREKHATANEIESMSAEKELMVEKASELFRQQQAIEEAAKALDGMLPDYSNNNDFPIAREYGFHQEVGRALQAQSELLLKRGLDIENSLYPLRTQMDLWIQEKAKRDKEAERLTSTVVVELCAPVAGEVDLNVETCTAQARWKPTYEVRLMEDKQTMELLCFASVSQASGEEWKDVQLEVSSAQLGRSLALPTSPKSIQVTYLAPGVVAPGNLEGRITDPKGRALAGVRVTASCESLKLTRTVQTDARGAFRFQLLPQGYYQVRAKKSSMPEMVGSAQVESGKTASIGLYLAGLPEASATVEVVASIGSVDRSETKTASFSASWGALESIPTGRFSSVIDQGREDSENTFMRLEDPFRGLEDTLELGRSWKLKEGGCVPSNGRPKRLLLGKVLVSPSMHLRAVPRVSMDVFKVAAVQPPEDFPWFPNVPMTVFKGSERLGIQTMPYRDSSSSALFSFGPVGSLKVQRTRTEATVATAKGEKNRVWSLKEQVLVVNESSQTEEVEILEPTIASTTDKVIISVTGEPMQTDASGQKLYKVRVPAKGRSTLQEGLQITAPATGFLPELPSLGLVNSN